MKTFLTILCCLWAVALAASDWYVALEAGGGANNGTSWADAWTNFPRIAWNNVQAGDTIWVSGGTTSNVYVGDLSDNGWTRYNGTRANPVRIKVATNAPYNGRVVQYGQIQINASYRVLDGSKSDYTPTTVLDTYNIATNINWNLIQTNNDNAVLINGAIGSKVKWLEVYQNPWGISQIYAITTTGTNGDGTEIAYNYISRAAVYGIYSEAYGLTNGFGMNDIHHNLMEAVFGNYFQILQCADIHHNVVQKPAYPAADHTDTQQDVNAWIRNYDNITTDNPGYAFYVEANEVWSHDIYVYNNLFFARSNAWQAGIYFTGHDASPPDAWDCNISNFWCFNNTFYNKGPDSAVTVLAWNRSSRPNGSVSNFYFFNNAIVQVAPYNNVESIQLYTNKTSVGGQPVGFDYAEADVQVNYNNISGGTGYGQGIRYGKKGWTGVTGGYQTMAEFAADTSYKSNNNNTAIYLSLTNYDFRVGADTNALKGQGTNLAQWVTNVCPDAAKDILGNARGASWDIGAYQSDSSLVLWLSFNNSTTLDDSGYGHHAYQYSTTNQVVFTNAGVDGNAIFFHTNGTAPDTGLAIGPYLAVTNLTDTFTNMTIGFWANFTAESYSESYVLDAGYDAVYAGNPGAASNSFIIKRSNSGGGDTHQLSFIAGAVVAEGVGLTNLLRWPVDAGSDYATTNFHHYVVTVDCVSNKIISYYDGQPYQTNGAWVPWLRVYNYLCIGSWHHEGTPEWGDDAYPNAGFFAGTLDDIRIYNRTLTATEVAGLYSGGGASASSSSPSSPSGPTANFTGTPLSGLAPLEVMFTDSSTSSTNITSWAWDFNNNGAWLSTNQSPTFTYTNAGTYSPKLTVIDALGTNSLTRSSYITVTNAPAPPAGTNTLPTWNVINVNIGTVKKP